MGGAGGLRFGVDLGGTKTEVAVLSGDRVLLRRRAPTPGSYDETLDAIAALLAEAERAAGARAGAVGVGTPGSLSPATGLMRNANSTRLNGRALDRDLAERLGRPVRLANDADCFALAEARLGAGRGCATVLGLILGTGVGAGIVTGGRLVSGPNGIAGEWGHNGLARPAADELPGPACWCGRQGCIEAWCSGPGLAGDHERQTGERLSAEEIAAHADRLGRGLAAVVNVLDPQVIVLGGGLSNLPGLAEGLAGAMRPHVFSDVFATPVRRHALGDSAGVIGAAWLCDAAGLEAA